MTLVSYYLDVRKCKCIYRVKCIYRPIRTELGSIVNLVGRRRSSLSRSERPPDRHAAVKFSKSRVRKKSSTGKYCYFCRYLNLFIILYRTGRKSIHVKNQSICPSVSIEHRLVTDRHRQTDTDTRTRP